MNYNTMLKADLIIELTARCKDLDMARNDINRLIKEAHQQNIYSDRQLIMLKALLDKIQILNKEGN